MLRGVYILDTEIREIDDAFLLEPLVRLYIQVHHKRDLRPSQWEALRFFHHDPGARLSDFASWRRSTMGTTSITVSQLVKRGLLAREGDRNVNLRLTQAGKAIMADDPMLDFRNAIQELPDEERAVFRETLSQILERVSRSTE